jgi:X-X-X-Leu-X-X-Gly heptad repeat protein
MKKRISCIILVLCLLVTNSYALSDVKKDETVYVQLKHDGAVEKVKIVNHIYGTSDSEYYTDYGSYIDVKNMINSEAPEVKGDEIKWPIELLKEKDIYYEGTINKELPIQVNIKYSLDGKVLTPKEVAGKSGRLKIELNVVHSKTVDWDKAGLITQIQLTPDLDVFSNIKSEGSTVIVGKKANITFVVFPPKAQTINLEADVENLYLDPISLSVVSSSFSLPEDIESGFNELSGGIDKLYGGTSELSKNSQQLSGGLEKFHGGLNQISEQGGQLITGFGQIAAGMEALSQKGKEMHTGIGQLSGGIKELSTGTKELSAGIDQLSMGHTQLMQLAAIYAKSDDPMLRKLVEGIMQEGEALQKLNTGMKESSKGLETIEAVSNQVYNGFGEYKSGIGKMAGSMKEMNQGVSALPEGIKQLTKSFGTLRDGISRYFKGVDAVNNGLGLINKSTKTLPSNMSSSLLGSDEENYTSFADSRNKNSTVQFIMRTPSIDRPEVKNVDTKAVDIKKGFFERLLDLFRR